MSGVRSTKLVVGGTFVCVDLFSVFSVFLARTYNSLEINGNVGSIGSHGVNIKFDIVALHE